MIFLFDLFKNYFFLKIVISKSTAKNAIIRQRETIKIVPIELDRYMHNSVIIPHEINAPITIAKTLFQTERLENPAIKLPVHTPVSGNGIATKLVSNRYFFNSEA